ncbi:hypothetical protein Sango_0444100 [Sesamum angolense]|uniref:Reverse transcriptase RNase H-like domain-containing protein n=1 Tax=Sesamum angolense TaxID=2727404 RepID=A0AAE1XBS5_9LAMI|nr:hypothetical protein Sango_0444100 [Sesamum angolense]
MDLQPSQNSHDEGNRLQTSESLSGFFSRITVSNKTMERIMRQDSNLSPYDFRIGGIGKVLNQIGLNQRKHHIIYKVSSDLFLRKEYIEIPRIFKEFAKVMAPDPIRIPRIGGVDIVKDHPVLDRTMSSRIEYGSRMSFSEDRITGYKGKEKDLSRVLTPQEIREARETLPVIAGRDFSQKILILNTGIREAKIMIGGAFGTPWFRVKTPPIYFHDTGADILLVLRRDKAFNRIMPINFHSKRGDFDAKLTNPKMQDKRKFGKVLLSFRQQGLIETDSFQESEEELKNLKEAIQELKTLDISEESILSLENVKRIIQRNFSENPLAWWDRNKIKATLKIKDECKYDSPGFLVRNHGEIKRGKPRLKWRVNQRSLLHSPHHKDEDELVVYTDANDYRWAAVLMKKTTTGEEPCRYTGGLFTEQQAQVWHINEKEFFAVWKAFKKWPLFLLAKEFTLKVDNTNVKAFLKNKLESKIEKAQMEGAEANSVMLRLRHLRENLEELDREFGRLAVNAQVAGQVQRTDLDKVQTNIRSSLASKPVAADSSTACTRPSSDSGETATDESQGVKTSDDSSQPSTSGVKEGEISLRPMTDTSKTNTYELSSSSSSAWQEYQRMWEKLISRKGVNPSKTIIETTGKYNRVWMMEGSKPEEVREWYEFGALASVHTMSPSFPEISKLPEWISGAVYDSWQNNPHLKRGDILELKFISAAPEMAGKGSHPAFHFIKLQRPDMVAFNRIKATSEEAPLVSAISEDDISTRRAWGLCVCLTEMDKVKYPFKIFSNKVNGSFLLNSMTGKSTEFAESMFEKKRMLIWENKLPATESTRMKACNMLHVGQWHNHVCPCCEKQEKPMFGTKIRVTQKKPEPNPDKGKRKNFYKNK